MDRWRSGLEIRLGDRSDICVSRALVISQELGAGNGVKVLAEVIERSFECRSPTENKDTQKQAERTGRETQTESSVRGR